MRIGGVRTRPKSGGPEEEPTLSDHDPRPIEARLEAAFDRFNRAAITGMEPTPVLFIEALEAEGLHLSLAVPETLGVTTPEAAGAVGPKRTKAAAPAGRRADGLVPGRVRALF